jgi:hypothetical protein
MLFKLSTLITMMLFIVASTTTTVSARLATPPPTVSAYPSADPTHRPTASPSESAFPSSSPSTSAPTEFPTSSPTFSPCKDTPGYKHEYRAGKGCKWAASKPNQACKMEDTVLGGFVRDYCPSACDRKCSCTNWNSTFKIEKTKGKKKKNVNCKTLKKKQCDRKAGKGKIASFFCPAKCGTCYKDN